MNTYLERCIAQCQEKEAALLADGRGDEAVFEKIRANVFGIFQTVWNTGRGEAFFREKLTQIPTVWQTALEKARAHGDEKAVCLETIKLEAVREIEARLEGQP